MAQDVILIVEDDLVTASVFARRFSQLPTSVTPVIAYDGRDAERLAEILPDAPVFIDLSLPDQDGLSLATTLRQRQPDRVLVAVSACEERITALRASLGPFDAACTKASLTKQDVLEELALLMLCKSDLRTARRATEKLPQAAVADYSTELVA